MLEKYMNRGMSTATEIEEKSLTRINLKIMGQCQIKPKMTTDGQYNQINAEGVSWKVVLFRFLPRTA